MAAVCRLRHELPLAFSPDLPLVHDVGHRVLTDLLALCFQCPADARAAVDLSVLLVHRLDLLRQRFPTLRPPATRSAQPGVVARAAHLQHLTDDLQRKCRNQMRFDERELHGCSLAKNCAAFFKISRSINSRAFSLRNRRSSAAITPSPLGAIPGSAENLATHWR